MQSRVVRVYFKHRNCTLPIPPGVGGVCKKKLLNKSGYESMLLKLPYGKEDTIDLSIKDSYVSGIIEPNDVFINDEVKTIRSALENPINSENLHDFLADSRDCLFIVNDATRPTPTAKILDILYDDIKECNIKFLIATGAHRAPTEEECIQIFGKQYENLKGRIFAHDARKTEDMYFTGKPRNGTDIYINKLAVETDRIVIISSVEPHYFAGYTGGRKSFLPGIASFRTIEQNHKLALSPDAKSLALEGNPVHEDMTNALKIINKKIFSLMTVLDKNHRIYAATSGDINDSFIAAAKKADDVYAVRIKEKADIIVSVVKYPMDINLYQLQKGIENAKHALKENGILIVVSKCRLGIGENKYLTMISPDDTPESIVKKVKDDYVLGYHKVVKMAEINLWAKVWAVTGLDPEILKKIFIKPYASIQEAVDNAIKIMGKDSKVIFLLDSSVTIPML